MIYPESAEGAIHAEQVSLIIGDRWVISCQEHGGDTFNELRNRLRAGKGKVRSCSADFLGYSLLDSIVDGYFGVLERLGDDLERVEQRVLVNPSERSLRDIHRCKRMVMYIRRAIWPLREVMVAFERDDTPLIAPATKLFIRDAYDHTVEVIDIIENFRETSAGLLDVYLSSLSNRLNSTMMVLALVTTIFMPLTFIAGIYGMNFEHMPELKWYYGYPAILAVMGIIAGAMVYLFHRRRWL
jgi:magnesium transporter